MLLVLSNKGKGMQSSSEQPLVGEERYVTTLITAAKETRGGGGEEIKNKAGKKSRQSEANKTHYLPFLLPLPFTFLTNFLPQILLSYFFEVSLLVYYFFTSLSSGTARQCYAELYYTYRGLNLHTTLRLAADELPHVLANSFVYSPEAQTLLSPKQTIYTYT